MDRDHDQIRMGGRECHRVDRGTCGGFWAEVPRVSGELPTSSVEQAEAPGQASCRAAKH